MFKTLLANNLFAILVHICMCVILFLPIGYIWGLGVWDNSRNMALKDFVYNCLAIGICTIVTLSLYFLAGRKFLSNVNNVPTHFLSVLAIGIIIAVAALTVYKSGSFWVLLVTPIYPISETISYFFRIELKYAYLLMSLLPSLTMWAGMITKRLPK